jgi:hypothetical protein
VGKGAERAVAHAPNALHAGWWAALRSAHPTQSRSAEKFSPAGRASTIFAAYIADGNREPQPKSGRQEFLEALVNRFT